MPLATYRLYFISICHAPSSYTGCQFWWSSWYVSRMQPIPAYDREQSRICKACCTSSTVYLNFKQKKHARLLRRADTKVRVAAAAAVADHSWTGRKVQVYQSCLQIIFGSFGNRWICTSATEVFCNNNRKQNIHVRPTDAHVQIWREKIVSFPSRKCSLLLLLSILSQIYNLPGIPFPLYISNRFAICNYTKLTIVLVEYLGYDITWSLKVWESWALLSEWGSSPSLWAMYPSGWCVDQSPVRGVASQGFAFNEMLCLVK